MEICRCSKARFESRRVQSKRSRTTCNENHGKRDEVRWFWLSGTEKPVCSIPSRFGMEADVEAVGSVLGGRRVNCLVLCWLEWWVSSWGSRGEGTLQTVKETQSSPPARSYHKIILSNKNSAYWKTITVPSLIHQTSFYQLQPEPIRHRDGKNEF